MTHRVIQGDSLDALPKIPAGWAHAVVTDPPYGIGFLGHGWDHGVPGAPFWAAAHRASRDDAVLAAFASARTQHLLGTAIEAGGWEIFDVAIWLYGSGMPKHRTLLKPGYEPIILARKGKGTLHTEHVVFGVRGSLRLQVATPAASTLFLHPREPHSVKPDAFMDLVRERSPGPRLELFARRPCEGFDSWGNDSAIKVSPRLRLTFG